MKNADSRKLKNYRRLLYGILCCACFALVSAQYLSLYQKTPNMIKIKAGQKQEIDFKLPASATLYKGAVEVSGAGKSNIPKNKIQLELDKPVTLFANQEDQYHMEVKLFGIVPFKTVQVQVIQDKMLIPAGIPIGIYVKTQGVLVIGTGNFNGKDGSFYEPAKHILKTGDYIESVNGKKVQSKKELMGRIQASGGRDVILEVIRAEEKIVLKIQPKLSEDDQYKIGIWIRDSAQGIGTLTFIDEKGNFGALGHGINDVDTSTLMNLEDGTLYKTTIIGIRKGENGIPGELTGTIDYGKNNRIGVITENTDKGIFGTCNKELLQETNLEKPLSIGLKSEVHKGNAQILCEINGMPSYYDIEILEVNLNSDNINRGIVLKIKDSDLLALTGGIVQGMSGSPIIQDGKIIGAVTHVLVQDATKGFGIFIENMLRHS